MMLLGYSDARVHQLMDWHARFMGPGHRIAGHSLQMLDAVEILLGAEARREALLHLLVDLKIVKVRRPETAPDENPVDLLVEYFQLGRKRPRSSRAAAAARAAPPAMRPTRRA